MTGISTHVLDTALGRPAAGIPVVLESEVGTELARGVTDADGRISALLPGGVPAGGTYRLTFDLRSYAGSVFYPQVVVCVVLEAGAKYHLPLLLSPFGYSTYRGS